MVVVLDALGIVSSFDDSHLSEEDREQSATNATAQLPLLGRKILLAEDTVFFRKHVEAVLREAGAEVFSAVNGFEAWDKLQNSSDDLDIVVSDIEMPKMDGFELCQRIRADEKFRSIPTIALTTKFRKVDIEQGKKVGFSMYLEKLNAPELIEAISLLLKNDSAVQGDTIRKTEAVS